MSHSPVYVEIQYSALHTAGLGGVCGIDKKSSPIKKYGKLQGKGVILLALQGKKDIRAKGKCKSKTRLG